MPASPIAQIIASASIACTDGRTPSLSSTYKTPLDNANLPSGVVVADSSGIVEARFVPSSDTAANINITTPDDHELFVLSDLDMLGIGDGATVGGLPISLNSQSCIFVSANGTAVQNGTKLSDALTAAAARTPYGSALSSTNMIYVVLGPGQYDLRSLAAGDLQQPNYVGIVGLCGSLCTTLITDSTHRLEITQAVDGGGLRIAFHSHLKGMTFSSPSDSASLNIAFVTDAAATDGPININHEDIRFTGISATTSSMIFATLAGTNAPVMQGYAKNVKTTGRALYGGFATSPALASTYTCNVRFDNCEAGNRSFGASGSAIGTRDGSLSGTLAGLYNCRNFGSGAGEFSATVNCPMVDCDWGPAIQRVGSSAQFIRTRVREAVSSESIEHSGAVTCKIAHCMLVAAIGSNITNSIASGSVDAAGNFVDADVA